MIDDIGDFNPKKDSKYHRKIYRYSGIQPAATAERTGLPL